MENEQNFPKDTFLLSLVKVKLFRYEVKKDVKG